jgi:hypothetical protein
MYAGCWTLSGNKWNWRNFTLILVKCQDFLCNNVETFCEPYRLSLSQQESRWYLWNDFLITPFRRRHLSASQLPSQSSPSSCSSVDILILTFNVLISLYKNICFSLIGHHHVYNILEWRNFRSVVTLLGAPSWNKFLLDILLFLGYF